MVYELILFGAAKKVGVSFTLLLAICSHESNNFNDIHVHNDGGSPSVGICMVKQGTAQMLGYTGNIKDLEKNHEINAYYAAKYLKYQLDRYGGDIMKATAAYNSGSYNPSKQLVGCPRNTKYLKKVQKNLDKELKPQLNCGKF